MRIILLGPPGAGKGTQAKIMSQRLKLVHISTGELLRQNVSVGTPLGKEAKGFMQKGTLVSDELVTQMLIERLKDPDAQSGFILDGYPRNLNQAKILDQTLKSINQEIDLVLYLEASEPVIIQRLSGRLVCSSCGANFHIKNMPPKEDRLCDNCRGSLYQREDDKEETVKKRLLVYQGEVSGLIQYYQQNNRLHRVNSDEEPVIVLNKIIQLIQTSNGSHKI